MSKKDVKVYGKLLVNFDECTLLLNRFEQFNPLGITPCEDESIRETDKKIRDVIQEALGNKYNRTVEGKDRIQILDRMVTLRKMFNNFDQVMKALNESKPNIKESKGTEKEI